MNIDEFLISEGFKSIEHRGSTDRYVKDNITIEVPYIKIIVDNKPTHMLAPYRIMRLEEIIDEIAK